MTEKFAPGDIVRWDGHEGWFHAVVTTPDDHTSPRCWLARVIGGNKPQGITPGTAVTVLEGHSVKVLLDEDGNEVTISHYSSEQRREDKNVQLQDRLEREQEANARLLKTIEEVCEQRDQLERELNDMGHVAVRRLDLLEATERERDDLSRRLSDIVDFVLGGDKPSDEDVEFNPEPGQCWHTINKDYDFIYRWNEDASSILIWRPWKGAWEDSFYKSFTNIENAYGDLEPVENPESNA